MEMKLEDQEGYKNYLRMTRDNFLELLNIVKGDIESKTREWETLNLQMLNWQQPYVSGLTGHLIQIHNMLIVFTEVYFKVYSRGLRSIIQKYENAICKGLFYFIFHKKH